MTSPITPDPSIHNDPTTPQQLPSFNLQPLLKMFADIPAEIIELIVNAVLSAFGLGRITGSVDDLVNQLENALLDIPQGNIAGLVEALAQAGSDIIDAIVGALGGPTSGNGIADLIKYVSALPEDIFNTITSILQGIPVVGNLITFGESLIGGLVSWVASLLGLLGHPIMTSGGSGATTSTGETLTQSQALSTLLGLLPTNQPVPTNVWAALAPAASPNIYTSPASQFLSGAGIQGQGLWMWDGWVGTGAPNGPMGSIATRRPGLITVYVAPGTPGGIFTPAFKSGVFMDYLQDPDTAHLALGYLFNQLDPEYFEVVYVPYPTTGTMSTAVQQGINWMINTINTTPGPFILVGQGQGTLIMSGVYDQIRYGQLTSRDNDLLAGVMFGNMRREEGAGFPGYTPPVGTSGAVVDCAAIGPYANQGDPTNPAGGNLIDTEPRWWEMAAPGDYLSCCPVKGSATQVGMPFDLANAPGPDQPMSPELTGVIDAIVELGLLIEPTPGFTLGISGPMGYYYKSYGSGVTLDGFQRLGSVTKGFTATAILIAVDEGLLTLDDTLDTYVSGVANGDKITIRQMLMQTSGVYDTEQDALASIGFLINPAEGIDEYTMLGIIRGGTPNSEPGTVWYYTESNFILLGFILEAIYPGKTAGEVITEKVCEPLGLTAEFLKGVAAVPSPANTTYVPVILDYLGLPFGDQVQGAVNMDYWWTAGAMAGTIYDLVKFATASGAGTLLSAETQLERLNTFTSPTVTPMEVWAGATGSATYQEWGLGWFQVGSWVGNDGSIPGNDCCCMYEPVTGTTIAAMENVETTAPYVLAALSLHWYNIASYLLPGSTNQPGYSPGSQEGSLNLVDGGQFRNFFHWVMQTYAGGTLGAPAGDTQSLTLENYYIGNVDSPQSAYFLGQPLLGKGDGRSYAQIAVDYINSFAGGAHPDGTPITAPPVEGIRHQLIPGQPVAAKPGQVIRAGASVIWNNIGTNGASIIVAVNAYDIDGNLIGTITAPQATLSVSSPSSGWLWKELEADFVMPPGTYNACLVFDVEDLAMTTGKVWFAAPIFEVTNLIDGSLIDQTTINQLSGLQVTGPQGIADVATAFQNMFDSIASGTTQTDQTGTDYAAAMQALAQSVMQAQLGYNLGVANNTVLSNPATQPGYNAISPSAQATFPYTSLTTGTLNKITVTAGTSVVGHINCNQALTLGFVRFVATASATVSGVYVNVYTLDSTGTYTNKWSSGDIGSSIPDGFEGWVSVNIPGTSQFDIVAGQWIAIEVVSATNNISIIGETWTVPNQLGSVPTNLGAVRTLSNTGGNTPATLTESDLTYSGQLAYLSFDVSTLPPDYQAPQGWSKTSHGTYTYTIPEWVQDGDFLDVVLCGSGGSGGDADGTLSIFGTYTSGGNGQGATGGIWQAQTFTYGTDIPDGTTSLTVIVAPGPQAISADGATSTVGTGFASAPLFDAKGIGASGAGTSLTDNITVADKACVIAAVNTGYGTFNVTCGGKTMHPLGLVYNGNAGSGGATALYWLNNVSAGDVEVVATFATSTYATLETISFTGVSSAGLVTSVYGVSNSLSQEVVCGENQVIVQCFGALSAQLGEFSGGTKELYDYTQIASGGTTQFRQGLSVSYATETTTFSATANVADDWGGISVALNGALTPLLAAAGGAAGGPGGAGNFNPANTNQTSTGKGPGNIVWQGQLHVGGPDTISLDLPGNAPGGGSAGGDSSAPTPQFGADGAAYITARQGIKSSGGAAVQPPVVATYETPGTYTYEIPDWAVYLDFILLGGASGGTPGSNVQGNTGSGVGGVPGSWTTATISTTSGWPSGGTITVTVGSGGAQSNTQGVNNNGAASTVSSPGMTTYTGAAGVGVNTGTADGVGPGDRSYNGFTFDGGATVPAPPPPTSTSSNAQIDGNAPGGAGAGGTSDGAFYYFGGAGAAGAVWIIARAS
ncbi:hypothetical protein DQP57_00400 [Mycobacterium colombiense]|uniref:Uncharacterized protein n=1 Tax=Mycobacterium colombiense TaxID=339268 RepID=A0A329MBR9_9MYCO|nr:serine hydrolase [Mycobacterium colombiense]RAV17519.1 hypothetical protein DQP57_00400 [Mycobacterium colombiense]